MRFTIETAGMHATARHVTVDGHQFTDISITLAKSVYGSRLHGHMIGAEIEHFIWGLTGRLRRETA